jgi:hypothetical protein
MTRTDDDLTPDEREALRRLPREATPPPGLEDATVAALGARGLLRRPAARPGVSPWLALAASLALFAGGLAVGRSGGITSPPADGRSRFALFLYEDSDYSQPSPGGMEARVQEYVAWASEPRENGSVEGGEKLRDEPGAVVATGRVTAEPAPGGEPRLAGYFLVRAADRAAALEIARTCPHLRYGGSIVVREIEPT